MAGSIKRSSISEFIPRKDQPYFKVLYGKNSIDITKYVIRATYEEQPSMMTQLDLTCTDAEKLLQFVFQGGIIKFYGGTLENSGRSNYAKLFEGPIRLVKSDYQEEGDVFLNLVCMMGNGLSMLYNLRTHVYPDPTPLAREFVTAALYDNYASILSDLGYELSPIVKVGETSQEVLPQDSTDITDKFFQNIPYLNQAPGDTKVRELVFMDWYDIVKGIAEENGLKYSKDTIKIEDPRNEAYYVVGNRPNLNRPLTQDSQSDWSFLVKMSSILNCQCWLEVVNEEVWLFFMNYQYVKDKGIKVDQSTGFAQYRNNISFFAPLRTDEQYSDNTFYPNDKNRGRKISGRGFVRQSSVWKNFTEKAPFQLREVTVTEDVGMLNAVTPRASNTSGEDQGIETRLVRTEIMIYRATQYDDARDFNSDQYIEWNGQVLEQVQDVKYDQYGKPISVDGSPYNAASDKYYSIKRQKVYEVNQALVNELEETNPTKAAEIRRRLEEEMVITDEDMKFFVGRLLPLEEEVIVNPFNWRGVRVTATVDGNVHIHSQRWYDVYGIVRYSSNTDSEKFYLRGLTHVFEEDGFQTRLEFFK